MEKNNLGWKDKTNFFHDVWNSRTFGASDRPRKAEILSESKEKRKEVIDDNSQNSDGVSTDFWMDQLTEKPQIVKSRKM